MCIRICSVCEANLGKRDDCDCDQETHTYCPDCLEKALREVEEFEEEQGK